jgi:hypothetical protein
MASFGERPLLVVVCQRKCCGIQCFADLSSRWRANVQHYVEEHSGSKIGRKDCLSNNLCSDGDFDFGATDDCCNSFHRVTTRAHMFIPDLPSAYPFYT